MTRDLLYFLSLPERSLRALAVLLGGLVYSSSELLLPAWVRGTRLYRAVIGGMLRITIEFIGGAEGIIPHEDVTARQLTFRKAAGTGIEMVGLLTIGWSPMWLFAVAADITGGVRTYINELESEFIRIGVLPEDAQVNSTKELLEMLETTSGVLAEAIDIPPLTRQEMRQSWELLFSNARQLPDPDRLAHIYKDFNQVAANENARLGELSALVAASAVRAGIQMGQVHIFDFYRDSLAEIKQEGLKSYTLRTAKPITAAAQSHFDPNRITITQRIFGKNFKR